MKIKHILTLFCVTLTLVFLLASCADTSGAGNGETNMNGETNTDETNGDGGDGDEPEYTGPFEASNVSDQQCTSSLSTLNCFISVWNTENSGGGASATNEVKLPLVSGGTYDFYVNWGDGEDVEKIEAYDAPAVTHEYKKSGEYTIHIAGTIKGWSFFASFDNYGDATKLLNVEQWGSLSLGNTAGSQFYNASNFNPTATDAPDLSETTSLSAAFFTATNFNGQIGNWDVSQITDMKAMFGNATSFNQDISGWNVSQVTTMNSMFANATSFNNNAAELKWEAITSKVTNMSYMFTDATSFNQDISGWDVGNVTQSPPVGFATGSGLILEHIPFKFRDPSTVSEQNCASNPLLRCFISVWKTDHDPTDTTVTGYSGTMSVKLPLVSEGTYDFYVDWGDESDVQKITSSDDATHTYTTKGEYTIHIAGTIKGWRFFADNGNYGDAVKLLNVTQWGSLSLGNTDGRQFRGAENFNPTATDAPDVSETTSLHSAFYGASNFNADISDWDVENVTSMAYMFNLATSFNNNGKPLDWGNKTSKVTKMQWMFWSAGVFNQDISAWDVGEVTSMYGMFGRATNFNQDISDWDVSKVTLMNEMFSGASSFNNKAAALEWGEKTSAVTGMFKMFFNASAFNQNISKWNVAKVREDVNFATGSGLELNNIPFKFREIDTISKAICDANPLTNCFISVWNTANSGGGASDGSTIVLPLVNNGEYNFYVDWGDGEAVEYITNYSDATHTYKDGGEKTIHIAGTIKGWRFYVEQLKHGDAIKLLDVTQWGSLSLGNTAGRQFYNAENFNPTATDAPDVSETTSLSLAFASASKFNADISGWDVSQVTTMNSMFNFATSFNNNGVALNWGDKTSKVTDMRFMFNGASAFNQDISGWNVSAVTKMTRMFNGATEFNQNICEWDVNNEAVYDPFANDSALANEHNPFHDACTSTKSK